MLDRDTLIENLENVVSILDTVGAISATQDVRDAIDLIKAQKTEAERSEFTWSSDLPKVPGNYLMRTIGRKTPVVFGALSEQDIKNPSPWSRSYEFAGPIIISEPTPETGGQSCS
jgi:hypothetical protein